MKFVSGIVLLSLALAAPLSAAEGGGISELYVAPTVFSYTWKETGAFGEQLIKESGPLFGVTSGVRANLVRAESGQTLTLSGKLDTYGGVVTYDGHTQLPSSLPVSTDVGYFGTRIGCDAGWGFPVNGSTVGPFAGFDYRFWMRDLHATTTFNGNGNLVSVGGSTEYWQDVGTRLGFRWYDIRIADEWRLFAEGGVAYSLYAGNTVDLYGFGNVTLEPEGEWTPFAEAGVRYKRLRLAVSFEELRYRQSPSVLVGPYFVYQPASTGEYLGFSVGYCFW